MAKAHITIGRALPPTAPAKRFAACACSLRLFKKLRPSRQVQPLWINYSVYEILILAQECAAQAIAAKGDAE